MIIYVVRHAWAGQSGDPRYPDDALRPLTDKGRRRFRQMVKKLARRGFAPQQVATSGLVRARQTAKLIADFVPTQPPISVVEALAPPSRIEPLLEWTRKFDGADVAWVGHSPGIERLAGELIGADGWQVTFEKGAVAAIRFGEELAAGEGELLWLATAGLLRC